MVNVREILFKCRFELSFLSNYQGRERLFTFATNEIPGSPIQYLFCAPGFVALPGQE
jgi:hypothetical protein